MRGIVVTPGLHLGAPGAVRASGPDPADIRKWVLFWDKVETAQTNMIRVGSTPDMEYLEAVGILHQNIVEIERGGDIAGLIRDARQHVYDSLDQIEPGSWSMSTSFAEEAGQEVGRSLRVHLADALPVPTADVPLDEVLNFRAKRADEREAILALVDELYLEVAGSPDRPLAEQAAMGKLLAGARNHFDAVAEARFPYRLASIAADFNLAPATATALAALTTTAALGGSWPLVVGNTILAGATVSISQVMSLFHRPETKSPYRYLSALAQEIHGADQ